MAMDVETLLAKASENLVAGRSFGPVIERGETLVIPVAFVLGAGGGGGGSGPPDTANAGEGGGGGLFTVSYPIGTYVVRGDDVRWVPAVDATRIAIGVLSLGAAFLKLRAGRRAGS
jgi:uncharacterized spore protein YtfJ